MVSYKTRWVFLCVMVALLVLEVAIKTGLASYLIIGGGILIGIMGLILDNPKRKRSKQKPVPANRIWIFVGYMAVLFFAAFYLENDTIFYSIIGVGFLAGFISMIYEIRRK